MKRFAIPALAGLMASGCASAPVDTILAPTAPAFAETAPVGSLDDAADDPAIWVHPSDPAGSRVLGTDKQAGLYVYDLSGAVVQFLPSGMLNNVDLRQGVAAQGRVSDLAAATNRTDDTVTLFEIAGDGAVQEIGRFPTGRREPYGLCVADTDGGYRVFVTYKTGLVQMFSVLAGGGVLGREIATVKLQSQLEGCVYDEAQDALFVGEEARGLWRIDFRGDAPGAPVLIDEVGSGTGLAADVEGVSIWRGAGTSGYLVVSAQAQDRYVVYERAAPNRPIGVFGVSGGGGADAVSHTDGLDVVSAPLGPGLPTGLLVVQDDANTDPTAAQNFKFVDWRAVERALAGQVGGAPPQKPAP